jgi:serine/threonine protein kinase
MQTGELIQERYVLVEQIGRGGMAEVLRARDQRLDRLVAIKFLARELSEDPAGLVRFFSEAQSVARIQHAHVVTVLDFGRHDDHPYLVMEFVGGRTLSDLTGEPMPPERAIEILGAISAAAGAAHALGIIHRDIKPGNVLLSEDGFPKLADFGIASSYAAETLTATGMAIGSPYYISPEQASGETVTARSDVYSLGVVAFELLTGVKPFDADNVTAVAIAHVEQEPARPSTIVPELGSRIDAVVLKCLAKNPDDRFVDGNELAHDFNQLGLDEAAGTEIDSQASAAPVVAADKNGPRGPLNRPLILAASIILAALIAVVALNAWGPAGTRREEAAKAGERDANRRSGGPTVAPASPDPTVTPADKPSPSPSPESSPTEAERSPTPKEEESPTPEESPSPEPSTKVKPSPTPTSDPIS